MTRAPTGMYGGVSADHRRLQRRRRLLDAGLEIMGTEGWAATSVRRVAQLAGLSSRFFYESFDGLDALAVAVYDEITAAAVASVLPAVGSRTDPAQRIRAGLAALVRNLTDDPRRARIAFVEALGSEPLMERRLATMRTIADMLVSEARRAHPVIDDEPFLDVAALGIAGLFVELMVLWTSGEMPRSREQLIADISDLAMTTIDGAVNIARYRAQGA